MEPILNHLDKNFQLFCSSKNVDVESSGASMLPASAI